MTKKVLIAEHAGFCPGVRRAVSIAFDAIKDNEGERIFTYGELIHNPQITEALSKKGVVNAENLENIVQGAVVIIRSHGAGPQIYEELRRKDVHAIDATCQFVKDAQEKIVFLKENGYFPVILGEKYHPEVIALREYAKDCAVIESPEEAALLGGHYKIGLVSQTTQSQRRFQAVSDKLRSIYGDERFKPFNTICSATSKRQSAAVELAKQVEVMIVIGGNNSGNTKRLYEICRPIVQTHHIERPEELRAAWFYNKEKIGITAGASTPGDVIKEVADEVRDY